jgi:hypothetical protein
MPSLVRVSPPVGDDFRVDPEMIVSSQNMGLLGTEHGPFPNDWRPDALCILSLAQIQRNGVSCSLDDFFGTLA